MSKKKILEENTIRRFMKLASIDALTENYFDREQPIYREEEEEFGAEEPPMDDIGPEEEAPVDDFAGEEPMDAGAAASVPEEAVKEIVDAIALAVSEVTGTPVETVGGEEPPMDDMGAEPPMDEPPMDDVGAVPPVDAPPARREAYQEAKEAKVDDDAEVQEEAVDDEETEVKEESVNININKADLREEDDTDDANKEDLEEIEDEAEDKPKMEIKAESKKRKLTEKEMVSYITKRVTKRLFELAKKSK